jgi:hypothetical protein
VGLRQVRLSGSAGDDGTSGRGEPSVAIERQRPWERACIVVNGTPRDRPDADQVEIGSLAP